MNILKTFYYNERISILNNSNNTITLEAISGHSLMTMNIQPIRYCIDNILPQGIAMLSGSPKTGKSWLVLESSANHDTARASSEKTRLS